MWRNLVTLTFSVFLLGAALMANVGDGLRLVADPGIEIADDRGPKEPVRVASPLSS